MFSKAREARGVDSISIFGWTLADNQLKGWYGVTGGVGRARKLAMRRAPGLDYIRGRVGDFVPRVPPARVVVDYGLNYSYTESGPAP
ncbi:jg4640 [Pararge aegeria aegeria]|uniref:Jg4640 protein n=1 Tax=Pararge aegeria aegeria TaxID=348720 RepID=A0A8S4RMY5_9NEOP|nr:jg4640 [Pararge aegeria aegeria]